MTDVKQEGRLAGRTAVVTGASSGNGRTIALTFAREGATVICADLQPEALGGGFEGEKSLPTHELISEQGGAASFLKTDVTVTAEVEALADQAVDQGGRLDIWVNNAGVVTSQPLDRESDEAWNQNLTVNVMGTWIGARAAATRMRKQSPLGRAQGHIVNTGSIAGNFGNASLAAYSSSKGAVHAMTRALATELGPDRITVNGIVPGFFPTRMNRALWDDPGALAAIVATTPLPDPGRQEDLANAVLFLASEDSDWITGVLLPVDGGFSAVGAFSSLIAAFEGVVETD
jgi:NAD(P)-dependent dehydrogenase (short-subunit alcohol dehydrogenase family)